MENDKWRILNVVGGGGSSGGSGGGGGGVCVYTCKTKSLSVSYIGAPKILSFEP